QRGVRHPRHRARAGQHFCARRRRGGRVRTLRQGGARIMDIYMHGDYEVVRDPDLCIACRVCERQCANEVHWYDEAAGKMKAYSDKCVNCHRCVCLCPTHALKIVRSDDTYKINANWDNTT